MHPAQEEREGEGRGRKRQKRGRKQGEAKRRGVLWREREGDGLETEERAKMRETEKIRRVVEMKNGWATRRHRGRERYGEEAEEQTDEKKERRDSEERQEVEGNKKGARRGKGKGKRNEERKGGSLAASQWTPSSPAEEERVGSSLIIQRRSVQTDRSIKHCLRSSSWRKGRGSPGSCDQGRSHLSSRKFRKLSLLVVLQPWFCIVAKCGQN